jgi:hypothetical protein
MEIKTLKPVIGSYYVIITKDDFQSYNPGDTITSDDVITRPHVNGCYHNVFLLLKMYNIKEKQNSDSWLTIFHGISPENGLLFYWVWGHKSDSTAGALSFARLFEPL